MKIRQIKDDDYDADDYSMNMNAYLHVLET